MLELSKNDRIKYEADIREKLRIGIDQFLNEGTLQEELIKFN